jgi:hydrophobe/amphiphile efflux-3 (HAE3) family protein
VQVVFGPGTFINESARQLNAQLATELESVEQRSDAAADTAREQARERGRSAAEARAAADQARETVQAEFQQEVVGLALRYGLRAQPRIDDPDFVSQLVFDQTKAAGTPKRRFAYLFPGRGTGPGEAALVQVRMKPDLPEQERRDAIALVREAVTMSEFRLAGGGRYTVTGAPVVVSDLTSSITGSIVTLLIAAMFVMAATLALVFSSRLRLLPLAIALAAAALTFGALSLAGASLTMASVAVLPVLIGLAVDYAIQLQSRIEEERAEGVATVTAARRAAVLGAPTIATAAAATATGFLVLLLSPVPMVRGFGLLLVIGIVIAFACTVATGVAALVLADRAAAPAFLSRLGRRLRPALAGARELLTANRPARAVARGGRAVGRRLAAVGRAGLAAATGRPRRVLGIAAAVALLGWAVDTQTSVESDIQKLVPQSLPAVQDLDELQRATGVAGEVDVVVRGDDLTQPAVLEWMATFQRGLLADYGYSEERGCGQAAICPSFSLPDLFGGEAERASAEQIRSLIDAVPAYFSRAVITEDRTIAALVFGIRLMPLEDQKAVMDEMRRRIEATLPDGVSAELAGLPVLAAEANARVSSHWRRVLFLVAGLIAVFGVLLVAFRDVQRALVPLVPIALATGWSALILFLTRVPLNPMTVTLGALVIAISTEFSVLLSERYREERAKHHEPAEALRRTYASTGAAVLASGATAIAGFAVLVVSDIRMLRDFGLVTVVDLSVSLLGVLLVLPAVLLLAERGELFVRPRVRLRRPSLRGLRARLRGPGLSRPRLPRPRLPHPRLPRPRLPRPSPVRPRLSLGRVRPRRGADRP